MKTRRAFQIIVGVLATLVATELFLVGAFLCVSALPIPFFPEWMQQLFVAFMSTFKVIAAEIGSFVALQYLIPIVMFGLPLILLLLGAILLFLPERGKQTKNIFGSILSLIGIVGLTVDTFVFVPSILTEIFAVFADQSPLLTDVNVVLPLQIAVSIRLGLFVFFVGCALGIKPKTKSIAEDTTALDATEETEITEETETSDEPAPWDSANFDELAPWDIATDEEDHHADKGEDTQIEAETVEQSTTVEDTMTDATVEETPVETDEQEPATMEFAEFTPTQYNVDTDIPANSPAEGSTDEEVIGEETEKQIAKIRKLYEMRAITLEEYMKLVNSYLKK